MGWKPRVEYLTLQDRHYPILVRNKLVDGRMDLTGPMVVIWREGHFYPCPGAPIFFGDHQCGWWTNDNFDEWMEIPE